MRLLRYSVPRNDDKNCILHKSTIHRKWDLNIMKDVYKIEEEIESRFGKLLSPFATPNEAAIRRYP